MTDPAKRLALACLVAAGVSLSPTPSWAQERGSWEEFAEQFSELISDGLSESATDEQMMLDLYEMYCNPLNLNDLDIEQLRRLPFLDEAQVLIVYGYAQQHQPMLSTGELMAITDLNWRERRLLQLFTVAGPLPKEKATLRSLLSESKNELTIRSDIPLYTKMGYATYTAEELAASPNKIYRGSQPYLSLRYTTDIANRLEAGLLMEKDGGEDGVDYWAAYAVLHRLGCVERLAVGHFRASFGLGLVMNTTSSFGKLMMLSSIARTDRGFRRHSSMSETGYLQGAGLTLRLSRSVRLSAYASSKDTDGTLNSDSTGISSLKTDGYHRTLLERSKKGIVTKTDVGGNVQWRNDHFKVSATLAYTHFSLPLTPKYDTESSLYRLYNAQGRDFFNAGVCYGYIGRRVNFVGETALSKDGALATLNMLQADLGAHKLTLIVRSYAKDYVSINGNTFSENSSPQNESGIYLGWQYRLSARWVAEAYVDGLYFPWMKYQVSGSSYGIDAMGQLTHTGARSSLSLRYRIKSKQRDISYEATDDETITQLMFNTVQSLRLQHNWQANAHLTLKSTLMGASAYRPDTGNSLGWALGEQVRWQRNVGKGRGARRLSLVGGVTYFHTEDYSARVYAYEPGLRYTFGMRAFYYHGLRLVALATVPLTPGLDITAKLGCTKYFDRETIGTGLDQILQSHREDLQLQARWQF